MSVVLITLVVVALAVIAGAAVVVGRDSDVTPIPVPVRRRPARRTSD